jgi:hypothetical protein
VELIARAKVFSRYVRISICPDLNDITTLLPSDFEYIALLSEICRTGLDLKRSHGLRRLSWWLVRRTHHLLVCIKTRSVPEGKRLLMILPSVGGGNCNWPTNAKFSREPRSKRTTLPRGKIKFDMWRVRLEELETGLKLRVQERKNHDGKELHTSIQRLQAQCAGYARSLRGTRTHKISILDLEQNCKLEERERERRKLASSETDNGFTDIKSMNPVFLHDLTHTN